MNYIWLLLTLSIFANVAIAKKKKIDLDFEFVDKYDTNIEANKPVYKKKQWIHDPTSDLCQPLNCKKRELCLLEDAYTAVCVSKSMLHKNRDEILTISTQKLSKNHGDNGGNNPKFTDEIYLTDETISDSDIKRCKPCTNIKQSFVCGSDNRTYSSACRLDYHNCIHNSLTKVLCKGFCPCRARLSKVYATKITSTVEEYLLSFTDVHVKPIECQPQDLTTIGNRLLDWFSVIMSDTKKQQKRRQNKPKGFSSNAVHFPTACKIEAKWMFGHLDMNNDGLLTMSELYDLEHDQNERCIKPFIDSCDLDNDSSLSPREWCRCFEKTDRPCAAVRRRIKLDMYTKDAYVPDCDLQGFYRPTQCHSKIGICWCVDKHGVEFANTRSRSRSVCDEVTKNIVTQPSDDEDDGIDYDDNEGSAERPISY